MKGLLEGAIICSECGRLLVKSVSNTGKITLQHDRGDCLNSAKSYELPAVTLKEIKP